MKSSLSDAALTITTHERMIVSYARFHVPAKKQLKTHENLLQP